VMKEKKKSISGRREKNIREIHPLFCKNIVNETMAKKKKTLKKVSAEKIYINTGLAMKKIRIISFDL